MVVDGAPGGRGRARDPGARLLDPGGRDLRRDGRPGGRLTLRRPAWGEFNPYSRQGNASPAGVVLGVGDRRVVASVAPPCGVSPRRANMPSGPASGPDTNPKVRT